MRLSLAQVGVAVKNFLGRAVEIVARETKFVRRLSPLRRRVFLQALVFGFIENPVASLKDLAQTCLDLGVEISPQRLDQRLNERAIVFLKEMFAQAMETFKSRISLPQPVLQQLTAVYLTDSTVIALPVNMVNEYPGSGGDGPEATLKVQLVFDFLLGNLVQVGFRAGREPDQKHRDYLKVILPDSLSITDLGYFCLDSFKAIMFECQAHFLSRFLPQTRFC